MHQKIEQKSLSVGAVINLIMAFSGWYAFYLSNSQSLLLDGNFSFLAFVSTIVAIRISLIKSRTSEIFPFGYFVYESLYTMIKGVMIVIILVIASISNISKIIHYFEGETVAILSTNIILIYAIIMSILSFSTSFYYRYQNKKINNSSSLLSIEAIELNLDGYMSAVIGVVLISINFIDIHGTFGFLHYIGDSILVLILVLALGKAPFQTIRNSFIELAGGTLQNSAKKRDIEAVLHKHLFEHNLLTGSYISKNGSSYIVVAYLDTEQLERLNSGEILKIKNATREDLEKIQNQIVFELVLA